jgi:5'-AMP-activated protein kinase regulatory beta subunit
MSMTDMSSAYPPPPASGYQHHPATGGQQQHGSGGGGVGVPLDLATISAAEEDSVPTVFRWEHGGRNVYITGTFNGWSRQIPMHRSGNDFTYIHNLKRGKHAFKFIVDDEWRFAPDQPTVADIEGRINNFIDVTDFKAYTGDTEFENERHAVHCSRAAEAAAVAARRNNNSNGGGGKNADDSGHSSPTGSAAPGSDHDENSSAGGSAGGGRGGKGRGKGGARGGSSAGAADLDGEVYGHSMPDLDEYTKEPPPLPPHLRHIILNKPPQLQDTAALPVPQHVALNHLYCTAIKDNMMVLGITQRYKMKSCTTVYYSPC